LTLKETLVAKGLRHEPALPGGDIIRVFDGDVLVKTGNLRDVLAWLARRQDKPQGPPA
jgi:hypothetical protein